MIFTFAWMHEAGRSQSIVDFLRVTHYSLLSPLYGTSVTQQFIREKLKIEFHEVEKFLEAEKQFLAWRSAFVRDNIDLINELN